MKAINDTCFLLLRLNISKMKILICVNCTLYNDDLFKRRTTFKLPKDMPKEPIFRNIV